MAEDEMVGWHHQLNGHEFEQAPGDNEGQGSLVCCSPWGCSNKVNMEMSQRWFGKVINQSMGSQRLF